MIFKNKKNIKTIDSLLRTSRNLKIILGISSILFFVFALVAILTRENQNAFRVVNILAFISFVTIIFVLIKRVSNYWKIKTFKKQDTRKGE